MVRLTFLGTGDAFNSGGRFFTSILIDGSLRVLLDCSPNVVHALEKLSHPINTISHILITHVHGDHAGGLPFILLNLIHKNRGKITIIGPDELNAFVIDTYRLFYKKTDAQDVFQVNPPSSKLPFKLEYIEGVHPVTSYIYRLEIDGKSIVYTGDTAKMDLSSFAKDADILIHEASSLSPQAGEFGHSTPFEAAESAASSGVKLLALIHSPGFSSEVKKKVAAIFSNTIFPDDLQVVKV